MKITDYGLWYTDILFDTWTLMSRHEEDLIYLNGNFIGYTKNKRATIKVFRLTNIGFRIRPNTPGEFYFDYWLFPENYIPTDSDFEELP